MKGHMGRHVGGHVATPREHVGGHKRGRVGEHERPERPICITSPDLAAVTPQRLPAPRPRPPRPSRSPQATPFPAPRILPKSTFPQTTFCIYPHVGLNLWSDFCFYGTMLVLVWAPLRVLILSLGDLI